MTLFLLKKEIINQVKVLMVPAEAQSLLRLLSPRCSLTSSFSFLSPYLRSHLHQAPCQAQQTGPQVRGVTQTPTEGFSCCLCTFAHFLYCKISTKPQMSLWLIWRNGEGLWGTGPVLELNYILCWYIHPPTAIRFNIWTDSACRLLLICWGKRAGDRDMRWEIWVHSSL